MTVFFTADTHFGHSNIIRFTKRPFANVEEMDAKLIENWNSVVKSGDTVYVLGDFAYRNVRSPAWYRWQLNGDIVFIVGNHDDMRAIRKAADEVKDGQPPKPLFKEIHHGYTTFRQQTIVDGKRSDVAIVLCHYPMRTWEQSHRNAWHLWGHCHGTLSSWGKSFDVGVDCHNYRPISLAEVVEKMTKLPDNNDLVVPRKEGDLSPWSPADLVHKP